MEKKVRKSKHPNSAPPPADSGNPKAPIRIEESAITWQAPEFEYNPKDISWYWLSLIVAIILLAFSLWHKNFLFAIFTVIGWFVIVNWASRFPTTWEFKIDDKGINIKLPSQEKVSKFYAHSEIEGFDIHLGGEGYKELVLKVRSRFSPFIKINFLSGDEEKIKTILTKFVPKEEYDESAVDSLSRLVRF